MVGSSHHFLRTFMKAQISLSSAAWLKITFQNCLSRSLFSLLSAFLRTQYPWDPAECARLFFPASLRSKPKGAKTTKYTTPINKGVVIFEIARARPIHARHTGVNRPGAASPNKCSRRPMPANIAATGIPPR